MLISHLWLKDWIDHRLSPAELAEKLTSLGLETNVIADRRGAFENVLVGKVISCKRHPDADKLSVTEVDVNGQTVPIVCGAANVAEGQFVPVAMVGAVLPNGMKIEKRKLRGQPSEGMICSESELGLAEESSGIMVLEGTPRPGSPLREIMEIEDAILEVDLTPDRGDCLSLLGIAREVAAVTGAKMKIPSVDGSPNGIEGLNIEIKNPDLCPRYTAREISGVSIKPSPYKIRRRLSAVGIRPINNIVDVTNYVMIETGHPLHAFDRRDIAENAIIVRTAEKGEKFATLDAKEHSLAEADLVIADGKKAVALAGIMGGQNSEVKDDTKDVILEAAYFNPVSTRKTARRLGISTESSYRFERGVNPESVPIASVRAAEMMAELGGGTIGGYMDEYPKKFRPTSVKVRSAKVNSVLGTAFSDEEISGHLASLGFEFKSGAGEFDVEIPPHRHDMAVEPDFIEEVARLAGYQNISPTIPRLAQHDALEAGSFFKRRELNRLFAASGLSEAVNYSFINPNWREWLGMKEVKTALLANPINADQSEMRTSLLPGLLQNVSLNVRRGEEHVSLFETGAAFSVGEWENISEEFKSAGVMTDGKEEIFGADIPRGFFRLKGILSNAIKSFSGQIPVFKKPESPLPFLYNHRQLEIWLGDEKIGFFGKLHPLSKEPFEIPFQIHCFEISVDGLVRFGRRKSGVKPIPRFPGIKRDIAVIVNESEEVGGIVQTVLETDKDLIRNCGLFDLYRGKQVPEGKKSLAFRLYFQDDEKTLTDEAGDAAVEKILVRLKEKHKAELRG